MNFNPTKSQEFIKKKDQARLFKKNVGHKLLFLGKEGPQECTIPRSAEWMLEPHNVIRDLHKMMVLLHLAHHVP